MKPLGPVARRISKCRRSADSSAAITRPWMEPVDKLELFADFDPMRALVHAGENVSTPDRDRAAFAEHLTLIDGRSAMTALR